MANDFEHRIWHYFHKLQDKDLYISVVHKHGSEGILSLQRIQVYNLAESQYKLVSSYKLLARESFYTGCKVRMAKVRKDFVAELLVVTEAVVEVLFYKYKMDLRHSLEDIGMKGRDCKQYIRHFARTLLGKDLHISD